MIDDDKVTIPWPHDYLDPETCPHPTTAVSTGVFWDEPFLTDLEVTWYRWIDCRACNKRLVHRQVIGVGPMGSVRMGQRPVIRPVPKAKKTARG